MRRLTALSFLITSIFACLCCQAGAKIIVPQGYGIAIENAEIDTASFRMGESYQVGILFSVTGTTNPDRELAVALEMTDRYGTKVLDGQCSASTSTTTWMPGEEYETQCNVSIPSQTSKLEIQPVSMPQVFQGRHYLMIQLKDNDGNVLPLENPEEQIFRQDYRYRIADIFVTDNDVAIQELKIDSNDQDGLSIIAVLGNTGETPRTGNLIVKVFSAAERLEVVESADFTIDSKSETQTIIPSLQLETMGTHKVEAVIFDQGFPIGEAIEIVKDEFTPIEWKIQRSPVSKVIQDRLVTPVSVEIKSLASEPMQAIVSVVDADRMSSPSATDSATMEVGQTRTFELGPEPLWGYYRIVVELRDGGSETGSLIGLMETIIPATTVAVENGKLMVNGEPFLVKGVNVHSLDSRSEANTGRIMGLLKDHHMNTLRNDHPTRWKVELADEYNLTYFPLAPFSCTNTNAIAKRYDGDPEQGVLIQTRQFIPAYRDMANILFWNSANEIKGDTAPFLESVYPLYKELDPYQRPVVYSHLMDQMFLTGQDAMAMNPYFWAGSGPEGIYLRIDAFLEEAKAQGLPFFFSEFNSWWGPVERSGPLAMEGLFEHYVDQGLAGGIIYQVTDNKDRHPGLVDHIGSFNLRPDMSQAVKLAFQDIEILEHHIDTQNPSTIKVKLANKRDYTLRNIRVLIQADGSEELQATAIKANIEVLGPRENMEISIPKLFTEKIKTIRLRMDFQSHFGLNDYAEFLIFAPE